jgi:hypothetical protein
VSLTDDDASFIIPLCGARESKRVEARLVLQHLPKTRHQTTIMLLRRRFKSYLNHHECETVILGDSFQLMMVYRLGRFRIQLIYSDIMSRKTPLICYFEAETEQTVFLRVECFDRIKVHETENPTGYMTVKKTYPILYDKTEPVLFKRFRCRCDYCSNWGWDAKKQQVRQWCNQVKCAAIWMVDNRGLDKSVKEMINNEKDK